MTTPETGIYLVAMLAAMFLPAIVAVARGLRDNHMGGVILLNLMAAAASFGSSTLGLAALATLPVIGLAFFVLLIWAFVAPGRVQDREAAARHHELLAALKPQSVLAGSVKPKADWRVDAGLTPNLDRAARAADARLR